jgi:chromate transporter
MPRHVLPPEVPAAVVATHGKLSPSQLFWLFTQTALLGFGGVLPWAYRFLVERRKVLSKLEFGELLAFAQILPGPTICNLAVIVGHRNAGIVGGMTALAGMITAPLIIVITLGIAHQHYGDLAPVKHALAGMSAVAAGLVVAMALKMARDLPRLWSNAIFAGLMFAGVGVMRWPLLAVIGVLVPLALFTFRKGTGR